MNRRIEMVVCDVGSVLVRAGRSWLDDIRQAGFEVSEESWVALEPRVRGLPRRSTGEIDNESYLELFADELRGVFSIEDGRRITHASLVAEYPGIGAVFDALEGAGVATAALCNVNDVEWARLFPPEPARAEFPTLARIEHRFASCVLGFAKPDPRSYRAVELGTGVASDSILFFDDRAENVEAARVVGWRAEQIDHEGDTAAQMLGWLRHHGVIR